jgi:hypothetical protein
MSQIHTVRLYNATDDLVGTITIPHRDQRTAGHHLLWSCQLCDGADRLDQDYSWLDAAVVVDHHMTDNHPHLTD